ncbi:MAG: hypothetical protein DYG83_16070 [Candidatus Brocadia sp. AMX2]|uniref:RecG-like helicase n=1 Tax=Candidatus Brocadia sinica JPN1 TaxID=1197129 RepID=A0ABQ0K088_9BACT|nr:MULTISPECIES: hypothetical protein [Brocadia]KXK29140.1 MAG: hypothetical protein UZ01_02305 [Candidatus Brocadia sinica]MBC6933586.1 hypothetical protein [Candidatus Brocadia sp.]MBL1170387.1 hypothetical protein [Candidatus Brocadia sp. AMX1]NOG42309.1 hypothetical protein [Planctomycetota bacterium]KAA0241597.1 MAG: hypothetical protein EDM70_17465 [Candidatus Brocadia sp. AMX2]
MGTIKISFHDGLFAKVYEKMLADVNKAKAIYKQTSLYSYDEKIRKSAERRLKELELRKLEGY